MAAFDFPSSPSVNQTYTANGVTWKWNGTMWMRVSGAGYLEKIEEGNSKIEVHDSGSGYITAITDGTERVRIDNVGWLGLNQTAKNHGGQVAAFKNTNNANSWLSVNVNNNTGIGGVVFGDSDSWAPAYIQYDHTNNYMQFISNAAERLRITSAGNIGIGDLSPTKALTVGTTTPVILLDDQSSRTLEIRGPSTTHSATVLTTSTHDLLLGTNNTERLRITSGGDMGLGTASPRSITNFGSFAINGTAGAFTDYFLNGTRTGTTAVDSNGFTSEAVGSSTPYRVITNGSERLRIASDGQATFDKGAPGFSNQVIARFQAESSRRLDIVWHDSGSLLGFDLPGSHSYIFKTAGTERLRISSAGDATFKYKVSIGDSYGGGEIFKLGKSSGTSYLAHYNGGTAHGFIGYADQLVSGGASDDYALRARNDLVFATNGNNERYRITSDGDLQSGDITISGYSNTHSPSNYSVFLADNHANTFFGQNLKLDYNGANNSGNHQLRVMNQHAQIGGAGMLIGGNQSPNVNELNFYTVGANQPVNTRVDDTNKRLTIRSNGDITIRGTNSQYVEAAAFEQTAASKNAIVANNGGWVSFNALRNTNSTIISHNPNSNSGRRITFPVAGAVHFSMYQDIMVSGTTGYTQCRLYKNGSADRYALITYTNGQWDTIMMNTVVEVAANDYLEVYYTGGTITSMDNASWLSYNFIFYPINTNRG